LTITTYVVSAFGIIACGTTYFFPFDEKRSKSMVSVSQFHNQPSAMVDQHHLMSKTKEIDNLLT